MAMQIGDMFIVGMRYLGQDFSKDSILYPKALRVREISGQGADAEGGCGGRSGNAI